MWTDTYVNVVSKTTTTRRRRTTTTTTTRNNNTTTTIIQSGEAPSGDWVKKGSYHTAWSVPGDSSCSCSYAYGHGPAIGPHTGKRCWALLSWLWRAIAPLMKPWCAEGEVPTAANLNLYRGGNSRVNWHSDNEPLFGGSGVHKLIVSVKLWRSCSVQMEGQVLLGQWRALLLAWPW